MQLEGMQIIYSTFFIASIINQSPKAQGISRNKAFGVNKLPTNGIRLNIFILYMEADVLPQIEINAKMKLILDQLVKRIYGQA